MNIGNINSSSATPADSAWHSKTSQGSYGQPNNSNLLSNLQALINLIQQLIQQLQQPPGNTDKPTSPPGQERRPGGRPRCDDNPSPPAPPKQPPTQGETELNLDPQTQEAIRQRFNILGTQNFTVLDKDGNKTLSAGDVVSISGGFTGGLIRDITLSQEDIDAITGSSDNDHSALLEELNANRQKWQDSRPDQYNYTLERSGFIGPDARAPVNLTVDGNQVTGSEFADGSGGTVPDFNKLTVDDLFDTVEDAINSGAAEIRVSYDPEFGYPTEIFIDQDRQIADEEVFLSASNLQPASGNGDPQTLDLSTAQHDAIRYQFDDTSPLAFDGLATEYTGKTLDADGDQQLSAGDIIELRRYGGNAIPQTDFTEQHVLSADEVAAIEDFASKQPLNLSPDDQSRLEQAVLRQDIAFIPGDGPRLNSIIDKDGNGQVSVGDVLKIVTTSGFETGNPNISTRLEALTQEQFDRFEAGIPYNPSQNNPVSGGGVNVGGNHFLTGDPIPDDRIVDINGQQYSVGFLKTQVDDFAATFNPDATDAAFGIFDWGTSNSLAAGSAFMQFITDNFPNGEPQ